MIKIQEAKQVGVIYHYTSVERLLKILEDNYLKAYELDPNSGKRFLSFTRDKNFEKNPERSIHSTDVRIVLDGTKISERYKIQPHNYFANQFNRSHLDLEAEERILTDKLEDVRGYIIRIEILVAVLETYNGKHSFSEILHLMTTPSLTPELKAALEADFYGPEWIDMEKVSKYIEDRFEIECKVRPVYGKSARV